MSETDGNAGRGPGARGRGRGRDGGRGRGRNQFRDRGARGRGRGSGRGQAPGTSTEDGRIENNEPASPAQPTHEDAKLNDQQKAKNKKTRVTKKNSQAEQKKTSNQNRQSKKHKKQNKKDDESHSNRHGQSKKQHQNKQKKNMTASPAPLSASVPPNQPQQTSDLNYGRGETITILHIAEKPSIGHAIAILKYSRNEVCHVMTCILKSEGILDPLRLL
jgi:hypothetical protein